MIKSSTEKFEMVAKTFFGLEPVLKEELIQLGAENVTQGFRMVSFTGDKEMMYRTNIFLRTALRILKTDYTFKINNQEDYYQAISEIQWENHLGLHHTFAIDAVVNSEIFRNSLFAAQRGKDAIVDRFRKKYHKRPIVDIEQPDVLINIHINEKEVHIGFDSSGASLHKRGYRVAEGQAPLNPVLAAAMIKLSKWNIETPFVDPMTGTGTLAIEAALIARNIPPGMIRNNFSFQNWPDYDKTIYRRIIEEVSLNDFKPQIYANDISEDAIEMARQNVLKANLTSFIRFSSKSIKVYKPRAENGTIIINPPYGERMKEDKINSLYKELGDVLKENYPNFRAWIISSNKEAMKQVGLRPSVRMKLYNGSLDCVFAGYELFTGSMKEFKTGISFEND